VAEMIIKFFLKVFFLVLITGVLLGVVCVHKLVLLLDPPENTQVQNSNLVYPQNNSWTMVNENDLRTIELDEYVEEECLVDQQQVK
jgi:hypothetical protein